MTFRNVLDTFFLPEDADAFARQQGWQDAEQMAYYEDMALREQAMLPPPPPVIEVHELDKVDSREVYGYEAMTDWQDLAGVY